MQDFLDFFNSRVYIQSPTKYRSMLKKLVPLVIILLTVAGISVAGGIRDGSLTAYSNGSTITIRWVSEDETSTTGYVIERKSGIDGAFIRLTETPIVPKGSGASYEFVDNTAFRTTDSFYQYRITAVGSGADPYYVSVNHRVSGVRRTWGSIKAMFR
jgi:hypothetical protein